jgi:hypothetical protein
MNKFLLLLALVSSSAFGADQKISAPSGNLILDAKAGSVVKVNKTLQVDSIKNFAGTSDAPGMVPIGGMVAVMNRNNSLVTLAGAWTPPATGVIKDGFMRADGGTVPTCSDCVIPAGTVLPNMVNSYPRGNTTSGTAGGSNTAPAHYHGLGLGSGLTAAGQTFTGSSGNHSHGGTISGAAKDNLGHWLVRMDSNLYYGPLPTMGGQTGAGVQESSNGHSHSIPNDSVTISHTHGSSSVSGNIGLVTGGCDGNSNSSCNNEPAYVETVWVIRVK